MTLKLICETIVLLCIVNAVLFGILGVMGTVSTDIAFKTACTLIITGLGAGSFYATSKLFQDNTPYDHFE